MFTDTTLCMSPYLALVVICIKEFSCNASVICKHYHTYLVVMGTAGAVQALIFLAIVPFTGIVTVATHRENNRDLRGGGKAGLLPQTGA